MLLKQVLFDKNNSNIIWWREIEEALKRCDEMRCGHQFKEGQKSQKWNQKYKHHFNDWGIGIAQQLWLRFSPSQPEFESQLSSYLSSDVAELIDCSVLLRVRVDSAQKA